MRGNSFARFGNDLYSGKRSYPFVAKRNLWFTIAAVAVLVSIIIPIVKGGFNLGIDFRGGSEFTVSSVENTDITLGEQAVTSVVPDAVPSVTNIAPQTMRIQTERLSDDETLSVRDALISAYDVTEEEVTTNFVGPTWGEDVSRQALIGLVVFIGLAAILMALYFRTWKMSAAALIGLVVVMTVTAGLYSLSDFEVTPSAMIGFLTVLSYALYDTVVVFDKIKENTADLDVSTKRTFSEQVNLAVNQTLVRSINTSVVAVLPVASILFIGALLLGAGTLRDLSLALFIGIIIGTIGTLFIAAPMYAWLRMREPDIKRQEKRVLHRRSVEAADAVATT
ncbi:MULTISPECIES: protein translocase subunit SecF [unclassified Arthrobacter]|uniref:protein translocase subunit SecF n=1 Tax=unclassified Arthrobacter TaxID=235627 RepID=UPI001492F89C|nr:MULTISPECIES: protein translocase subunit SecF [unclassified Arthrobacter]MBE0011465.1 protein translocase subunit SecF [Arthrobacter sp. AET 35A]NOJ64441.1 protein translocase subunit SecF [Arthrobacter sp. 147(2020)]